MRRLLLGGLSWLTACRQAPSAESVECIGYGHLTLSAETLPIWSDTCLQKSRVFAHWAVSLVLKRDQILGVPEWVSGHRLALTAACETFLPELLIIETPPSDSLFYPGDSMAREAWQGALRSWLLEELLPMLSTYPSLRQVAWGEGFVRLPLPESFWKDLLCTARQAAPYLQWGLIGAVPTSLNEWDFVGHFVQTETPPESTTLQPLRKPTFYFISGQASTSRHFPDSGVVGCVLYSEDHLPVICR